MTSRFAIVLLILLLGLFGWFAFVAHEREQQLLTQISLLERQVNELETRLTATDTALKVLQEESVPAVLKRANSALLDAWQGLLDRMGKSLEESRGELEQSEPRAPKEDALKRT